MSKGDIKINISGGNAEFGNISQGDNSNLKYVKKTSFSPESIEEFYTTIQEISRAKSIDVEQLESLKNEVESLRSNPEDQDFVLKAKELYEKYSWAIDPLKKLFSMVLL